MYQQKSWAYLSHKRCQFQQNKTVKQLNMSHWNGSITVNRSLGNVRKTTLKRIMHISNAKEIAETDLKS